jgi:hypothetical protein
MTINDLLEQIKADRNASFDSAVWDACDEALGYCTKNPDCSLEMLAEHLYTTSEILANLLRPEHARDDIPGDTPTEPLIAAVLLLACEARPRTAHELFKLAGRAKALVAC